MLNACVHFLHNVYKMNNDFQVIDVGDGYNNQDGIFDVPVTGVYVFMYTVYAKDFHYVRAELVINGQVKTAAMADCETVRELHSSTATIVISVNAGDHVLVRRADTTSQCNVLSNANQAFSTFSGWMLY